MEKVKKKIYTHRQTDFVLPSKVSDLVNDVTLSSHSKSLLNVLEKIFFPTSAHTECPEEITNNLLTVSQLFSTSAQPAPVRQLQPQQPASTEGIIIISEG